MRDARNNASGPRHERPPPSRPARREAAPLLDLLRSGEPPAFAVSQDHRITFWNAGAARLLGGSPAERLGKRCHDVVHGRDPHGNLFCYENCAPMATARRGEPVRQCEFTVPRGRGRQAFAVTSFELAGQDPRGFTLVHILHPLLWREEPRCEPVPPGDELGFQLTTRESEVLELVTRGRQNKEIASELGISLATVRNHVHRVLGKLGVHSKLEAASLALRVSGRV